MAGRRPLGQSGALGDLAAQVVDLRPEDAPDALPARAGALEQVPRRHVVDLGVGGEHALGLGEAAENDDIDPFAPADVEPGVAVGRRDDVPVLEPGQVGQPFPRRDVDVFRLFEAGDEQVGDGLLEVVVRRIAGQVLEADDRDGVDRSRGPGQQFAQYDAEPHDAREGEDRDEGLLPGEGRHGRLQARLQGRRLGPGRGDGRRVQRLLDLAELAADLVGRLISLLAVLLHAAQDDRAQPGGRLRVQVLRIGRQLGLVLEGQGEGRVRGERQAPGDHLEEDDAEGIDVRAAVGLQALDLLGRHVFGSADDAPLGRDPAGPDGPGDPEVEDLGVPLLVDHDVARLEVAVDDARVVGFAQAAADLLGDGHDRGDVEPPRTADEALEILPGDVLEGDVVETLVFAQMVHLADVAVGDAVGQLDLVDEALERPRVLGDVGADELDGHFLARLRVEGPVDAAHAAPAQELDDLVALPEDRTGREMPGGGFDGPGDREGQGHGSAAAAAGAVRSRAAQGRGAVVAELRRL